jgi:hypothetical protein
MAAWRPEPFCSVDPCDDAEAWRPKRQTVVEIATGAYLSLNKRSRAPTADLLNSGVPTKDKNHGLDDDHVRHALESFVRKLVLRPVKGFTPLGGIDLRLRHTLSRWHLYNFVLEKADRYSSKPITPSVLSNISETTGLLFSWLLEAEAKYAACSPPSSIACHAILRRALCEAERERERQRAA